MEDVIMHEGCDDLVDVDQVRQAAVGRVEACYQNLN